MSTLVSDEDVKLMASACDLQLTKHVSQLSNRGIWHVKALARGGTLPKGCIPMFVLDDPDQANALGYHTEDRKGSWGRVFARPILASGGSTLTGALSVSAVLSHEVCEMYCDKSVNM